jgi:hypothetical protein
MLILCIVGCPTIALAATTSDGCGEVNLGALNFTAQAGGGGGSGLLGHPFAINDELTFTWNDFNRVGSFNAIIVRINGTTVFTSIQPAGSTTIAIDTPNSDITISGSDAGGFGLPAHNPTFIGICTSAPSGPDTPTYPPVDPANAFIEQDTANATESLLGDAEPQPWIVPPTPPESCDELFAKRRELLIKIDQQVKYVKLYRQELRRMLQLGLTETRVQELGLPSAKKISRLDLAKEAESGSIVVDVYTADLREIDAALSDCGIAVEEAPIHPELREPITPGGDQPSRLARPFEAFDILQGRRGGATAGRPGLEAGGNGWTASWTGAIYGLNGVGTTSFVGLSGRVDLAVGQTLPNGTTVGGFVGWDGATTSNAVPGGTTSSNALHMGAFGSYRLPGDLVLAVSGGTAFGLLKSTIGADSGTTATQRGFLNGSLTGTVLRQGPWHVTSTESLFIGAEHQNAFTTSGGTAIPEQTIGLGKARIDAKIGFRLPTELPTELFGTLGGGYSFGNSSVGGFNGSVGGGVAISKEAFQARLSATLGGLGASTSAWSFTGSLGGNF